MRATCAYTCKSMKALHAYVLRAFCAHSARIPHAFCAHSAGCSFRRHLLRIRLRFAHIPRVFCTQFLRSLLCANFARAFFAHAVCISRDTLRKSTARHSARNLCAHCYAQILRAFFTHAVCISRDQLRKSTARFVLEQSVVAAYASSCCRTC